MYPLLHYRDFARENAERAFRAPLGWMSPFWLTYGAAVGVGAAWWWMSRLGAATHLEAMHGEVPAGAPIEAPMAQIETLAGPSPVVQQQAARVTDAEPGADPVAAAAPPTEPGDDLTRMVGIGARLAEALADRGVTRFAQIAAWSDAEVSQVDAALNLKGRARRDAWVAQARRFAGQES